MPYIAVLTFDCHDQPGAVLEKLKKHLDLAGDQTRLFIVDDTGGDYYAAVIGPKEMTQEEAESHFRNHEDDGE